VIIGLFEKIENIGQALVNNLTKLFNQYGLKKKLLHMSNLNATMTTLELIVKCEVLGFNEISRYLFWPCFFKGLLICCK
jgi:sulfur relay (sulfurtransferase) DsrF/TusC family protein